MKAIRPFHHLFRFTIMLILLLACCRCRHGRQEPDAINPAFTGKISAFTSGTISSESAIRIILATDYPGQISRNTPAGEGLFAFKPAIAGKAYWLDNRTIEFRPGEHLKSGQYYKARFRLSALMDIPRELASFEFGFQVARQTFEVEFEGYQTQNEDDLVWIKMKGTVKTADVIDNELLAAYFKADQEGRNVRITWEENRDRRIFHFSVDSVCRTDKSTKVRVRWEAGKPDRELKGEAKADIPAIGEFKVMNIKVIHEPEPCIQVMFSDPLKKKQNFEGLVFLNSGAALNYTVEGNILRAYPVIRQTGEDNLSIQPGLMNIRESSLNRRHVESLTFEMPKPAVRLSGRGVILPSSKELVFPFEAINLNAIDVRIIQIFEDNIGHFLQVNQLDGGFELKRAGRLIHKQVVPLGNTPADLSKWNRFYLDLDKMIKTNPGSIYRVEIGFRRSYSLYACGEKGPEKQDYPADEWGSDGMAQEMSYWDSYESYYEEYYDYGSDYDWEKRDDPCSESYYTRDRWVARNILASDLGILAKSDEGNTLFCAVTNLVTTEPVSRVNVTVYNFQQQPIASGTTDKEGFVNLNANGKPFLLVAQSGDQRGYLRLDDGSSLSLGAFDVSGDQVQRGIKGFIYGERGVWRPGDTLFLTLMLEDRQKVLPEGHPVVFELFNPQGQLYSRHVMTSGVNGFYSQEIPTDRDVPTGNWNLKVKAGGTVFEKNLKIETVKPNRLKISLVFDAERLTAGSAFSGNLQANWLHGAIGRNLRTNVGVILTRETTGFEKYPSFQFTDPARAFSPEEAVMFDGYTGENGKVAIPVTIHAGNAAPGMLRANFTVRVFEKGGDFSIDRFNMPYSPYPAYVGIRVPEGDDRGMLLTDTTHWIDVVTVDDAGKPVSKTGLDVTVYKLNWRGWWESEGDELANYTGNLYNQPLFTRKVSTPSGKGRFGFRIDQPDWGRYYIRVADPQGGHAAGKIVFVDWPGWAGRPMRENPEAASILSFNTDKKKYTVGEKAELIIPTGGTGRILLSLETGSRILMRKWLPAAEKETRVSIPVTTEMSPNVYAHVTLIQPHASSANDMPVRLYGVITIFAEDKGSHLAPRIKMPESLEPLQIFNIEVSEQNRREMTYTLALVEDGLLDLTRFKTPDPWSRFYAREALGIKTWDLYDLVIGSYGGKLGTILGIGGDEEITAAPPMDKANRFKPVVRFLGPFALKAGAINRHRVSLPNYVGSVRVMVVAGQEGTYGSAERAVAVKKPMMVLATLPRVMGPGESVKLPVTVFAMDRQVKDVEVRVTTNGLLNTGDNAVKHITFNEPGDKMVNFDLTVAGKTGVGRVKVKATSGKITSEYEVELNIRTANPPIRNYTSGMAEAGQSWRTDYSLPGLENTNSAMLEVSGIPPIDAGRRLRYLVTYPHGCAEQITSTAFAQLYLDKVLDLSETTRSAIEGHIKSAISRLAVFQLYDGSFSYWPGQSMMNPWTSSYTGHFLLEAEMKGYVLPPGLKSSWIRSQKRIARQWKPAQAKDFFEQDDLEQAYRLYTLALAGDPETGTMNRMRELKTISLQAKWRLAAGYALIGQIPVAQELINRESTDIQEYRGSYSSFGSRERDMAMILETLMLLNDKTRGSLLARKISDALSSEAWMSTQTTAYCLLTMAKFSSGVTTGEISFSYSINGGKPLQVKSGKPVVQVELPADGKSGTGNIEVKNLGKGLVFTRLVMEGTPEAGNEEDFSNRLTLQVTYQLADGKAFDISRVLQGADFYVVATVYNPGDYAYHQLAMTQVFPPGWEISNARLADLDLPDPGYNYQDIRDDRIITYFNLEKGEKKTFAIQINAAYQGKFYLPGVFCEAMYDNNIGAMRKGQMVEVVSP